MKILMVARRYPPDVRSGTETVFANLYEQAVRSHSVQLVVGFQKSSEGFPPESVKVDLREGNPWLRMAASANREARRFRPEVVLANSVEVWVPGVPTAVIVHDLNFGGTQRGASAMGKEAFYRLRSQTAASVITVSEASRQRLLQAGLRSDRITVIPNGVDLQRFFPVSRPPSEKIHFVYPSRILPGKAQHLAIDAIGRMRPDQKKNLRLTIVGALSDRIYGDKLRIQAFHQPVDFAFDVPEMAPYYQQADVVLFPSLMEEGFGYTAVEGMACGKPVIWGDQPAVREATGGIGIPVPQDDADALKRAMLQLAEQSELRKQLGEKGREFVERYRWDQVWGRYAKLLEGIR
jgi:glycosyltransferase involved in cell wall biosynthesis